MNSDNLQKVTRNIGGALKKNSPTILTSLGVAGLIATTVMAVKATPKAIMLIEHEEYERKETLTTREIVELTWKCYLPAIGMGVITIACIIGANKINVRRNAAILSAYSISESALKEYQNKVVETIGRNKAAKIKDDIAKDKIDMHPVGGNEVIMTGKGETLCYDALSGRYFKSDIEQIRQALNKLSRDLLSEMTISVNDVYYELGLKGTKLGDTLGWHVNTSLIEPQFSSHLTETGVPCLVLDYEEDPSLLFRD